MNCRPGQIAMVIRGAPLENLGRVVKVLELDMSHPYKDFGFNFWKYEGTLLNFYGGRCDGVEDSCLRPLRDDFEPESIDTGIPTQQGETV